MVDLANIADLILSCILLAPLLRQLGAVRKLQVGDKYIWEELLSISELDHSYTYSILEYGTTGRPSDSCPFPAAPLGYQATVRARSITATGCACLIL